jgi:hypothetical protein
MKVFDFDLQLFAQGDEPVLEAVPEGEGISVPDAVSDALRDLSGQVGGLVERVSALEQKGVEAAAPAIEEHVVDPPPEEIVVHEIHESPVRKLHNLIG